MTLRDRALGVIPGGVSSPARAFGAVGGDPLFGVRGEGAYIFDEDGNRYIDYLQGFGSVILGHGALQVSAALNDAVRNGGALGLSSPAEVRLAELVCASIPHIERVRFMATGTEAGMTAARLARAATGRNVLIKFEGGYHGHADAFLAKAGSSAATFGVPEQAVADTVVLPYNDVDALEHSFTAHQVAAVFVEPVAANMGVVAASDGFLQRIVDLCSQQGAMSVFDEVVTGFRIWNGSAVTVAPDLVMLGKVIGGGQPVGAVAGRAEIMDRLVPLGDVFQAGTFAAHPHAMAAGAATLEALNDYAFDLLTRAATRLADGLRSVAPSGVTVVREGTLVCVFFAASAPTNFEQVQATDKDAFGRFHRALRAAGVLIPPSPFEAWFPSLAHTDADIDATIDAAAKAFAAS